MGLSKLAVNNFISFPSGRCEPCGLNIYQKIWWRFIPGEIIKVRWPSGNLVVDHNHPKWQDMGGAVYVDLGFSADPNDHYRTELEQLVGRQGWHWNWGLADNDVVENKLTIKIIRSRVRYASYLAIKWA